MVKILTFIIVCSLLCPPSFAGKDFTLYLVRHAEKNHTDKNPALTQCGKERAKQLASILSTTNIKSIYSTSYQRTMSTAAPLSNNTNIAIKNYSPEHLNQLSLQLIHQNENALVVGHSNTTPELVRLLTKKNTDEVAEIVEDEFRVLYQVHFVNNEAFLTKLKQPLTCN